MDETMTKNATMTKNPTKMIAYGGLIAALYVILTGVLQLSDPKALWGFIFLPNFIDLFVVRCCIYIQYVV